MPQDNYADRTPIHGHATRTGDGIPHGSIFRPGLFGRLFPHLLAHEADARDLFELGHMVIDPPTLVEGPELDNPKIPSGYTYFGQFIDHDITFDPTPLPEVRVDPLGLWSFRTPKLDLDSLYGLGLVGQPYLYERQADPRMAAKFLIGKTSVLGKDKDSKDLGELPNDLPRNFEGRALIADPRNDENLIIAQLHLAFLKFHNRVVEKHPSLGFEEVRRFVTWHYQRLILDDFLPRIADGEIVLNVLSRGRRFFRFEIEPFMPIEFSAAAYRLHTMVRETYDYNRLHPETSLATLRDFTGQSSREGAVPLPSRWIIDWRRFFDFGAAPLNLSRRLDSRLGKHLGELVTPGGVINLASRNLVRGLRLGLPTGQNVALAMGFSREDILSPAAIEGSGIDGAFAALKGFDVETPLWYYLMKEAELLGRGQRLGPVGSRLVAEVFVGLLAGDSRSFIASNPQWVPQIPMADKARLTMTDLLRFVEDPRRDGP